MKKVLLINPWIYDFSAFDLWLKPIGLLYILSRLKEKGISVSFIDCLDRNDKDLLSFLGKDSAVNKRYGCGNFHKEKAPKPEILSDIPRNYYRYGMPVEVFEKKLSDISPPDYVLVTSMMTYWYPGVRKAIGLSREYFPETKIILGGVYANLCPQHALEMCGADYVYCGKSLEGLFGIINGDFPCKNIVKERNLISFDLPFPDFSEYSSTGYFCVMTSQGCPFNCTYCASNILYEGFCQRGPESVVDEIVFQTNNLKCKNMAFYDDALLVNAEKHFEKILDGIIGNGLGLNLHSPNGMHPKFITLDMAKKMMTAGFKTIRISLETSDPERQSQTGGKVGNEDFLKAMDSLTKAGFGESEIGTYIFFGFPGQRIKEVEESIKFVKKQGSVVNLVEYSPIPGTAMWKELEARGVISENTDPLCHNNSVFFRKYSGISEQELQHLKQFAR